MMRKLAFLMTIIGLLLCGCSQSTVQVTPTITSPGKLTPYMTVTPTPTRSQPTIEVTIPITRSPTSTPFLYSVKKDDTMLGIAYHFGITLEELQAANPTVDSHYMGQGLQLVIPIGAVTPEALPTPTALPIHTESPRCTPTGDGGIWCIVELKNELATSLENLSVWIGLFDAQGNNFTSQTAYAPLNILRSGDTIPLMVFFSPPIPDTFQARSEVISALAVTADDERYLDPQVRVSRVEIGAGEKEARVIGDVLLPPEKTVSQLWLLAVAYDADQNIVGMRKWKSAGETKFDFTVYSLAGVIEHIEILVEARP